MDIMLERILSLVPKKENGKFQHGALKEFAQSIGLKNGNLISDWIAGRSKSYQQKIYEIAAVYHVSVSWLKGETDEKSPSTPEGEGQISEEDAEFLVVIHSLPQDFRKRELAYLREIANGPSSSSAHRREEI